MSRQNRVRKLISLDMKKEIISKRESGRSVGDLSCEYGMAKSTISTILKNKEEIKNAVVAKGISRLSSSRCNITEQMEMLLLKWIKEKQMAGDNVSEAIICEKAKQLFEELSAKAPSTSTDPVKEFFGTKGWFTGFRKRTGLHNDARHGEAANAADKDAAEKHREEFKRIIEDGGFLPQQVFNCDETGLFWKKLSSSICITKEESTLPDHKPINDRLTLLFCANASGDCKIKPLLVHRSENPRELENIKESHLGVLWRSNCKTWVTKSLFSEWITEVFGPTVRDYLREKDLPLKVLLVMDDAPAHSPTLIDELPYEFSFIKVHFFPPNTTSLLQPMDRQVIVYFKKLYAKGLFRKCFEAISSGDTMEDFWKSHFSIADAVCLIVVAWKEVSERCLKSAWRSLWPDAVALRDFEDFQTLDERPLVQEIMCFGHSMGLDINEDDVEELVDHKQEVTFVELAEMRNEDADTLKKRYAFYNEEQDQEKGHDIPIKDLTEVFSCWNKLSNLIKDYHPDTGAVEMGLNHFNDTLMIHFWKVLKSKMKQSTLDLFFKRLSTDELSTGQSSKRIRNDDSSSSTSSDFF